MTYKKNDPWKAATDDENIAPKSVFELPESNMNPVSQPVRFNQDDTQWIPLGGQGGQGEIGRDMVRHRKPPPEPTPEAARFALIATTVIFYGLLTVVGTLMIAVIYQIINWMFGG